MKTKDFKSKCQLQSLEAGWDGADAYHAVVYGDCPRMRFFVGSVPCMDLKGIVVQAIVELFDSVRLEGIMVLWETAQLQRLSCATHLG